MSGENEGLSGLSDEALDGLIKGVEGGSLYDPIEVGEKAPDPDKEVDKEEAADKEPEKETSKDSEVSEDGEADKEEDKSEAKDEKKDADEAADESDDEAIPPALRAQITSVLQRVEMLEAERSKLAADLEREKLLRDRNAGKLGALMQKLEGRDREASADEDGDEADAERQAKSKKPEVSDDLAEIRQERVERAITGASQEFLGQNQEFFASLAKEAGAEAAQKFQADLVAKIREHQEALGEDLFAMNPKLAAKVSRTLIDSAFADLKLSLMREFQTRAAQKSEKSRREVRDRKAGASGVRSNKRAAMTETTKPKSLHEMSDKELEAELRKVGADSF